ncbi:hypothetical protein ABK040_010159 [Willaertia magna]
MYNSNSLLAANILTGVSFLVHTFVGDGDVREIEPQMDKDNKEAFNLKREKWTQTRCGWHWISTELLLATVGLYVLNCTNKFEGHENFLKKLMSTCFFSCSAAWLTTIAVSKPFPQRFLKLAQYGLLAVIGGLINNSIDN